MNEVIIFGAGKNGLKIKRYLEKKGYKIYSFCDNNPQKIGLTFDNVKIISFADLIKEYQDDHEIDLVISILEPDAILKQISDANLEIPVWGISRVFLNESYTENEELPLLFRINPSKPSLDYLEYHVTEHCNLKCKGCGYYSNIAEVEFGDFEQYVKDMTRLNELYWGIKKIRLMGGEPLLNTKLPQFIIATRKLFPQADIRVVSNGLLIPNIKDDVLITMKQYSAGFDISQYPPTKEVKEKIELRCLENNVEYFITDVIEKFHNAKNPNGDSDINETFEKCFIKTCHYLHNGKMSICGVPIAYEQYKEYLPYEVELAASDVIDIYDNSLDGNILNAYLSSPKNICRYCNFTNIEWFNWQGNSSEIC